MSDFQWQVVSWLGPCVLIVLGLVVFVIGAGQWERSGGRDGGSYLQPVGATMLAIGFVVICCRVLTWIEWRTLVH